MINIRKIEPKDYQQTSEMIISSIKESFKTLYSEKLIAEFCDKYSVDKIEKRIMDMQLFVAEEDEKQTILGIIGIKENQLRTFFVHPEHQGSGIGRLLFNKLEEFAREHGLQKIILEGSPLGEPIYKHFGFEKTGTIDKERGGEKYTDALMEKELTNKSNDHLAFR